MAVETFVYIYIFSFAVSALIAIGLLVSAARRISKSEVEAPAQQPDLNMR